MKKINPLSQGPFTDNSDANMSLINDISNVVNNQPAKLPMQLEQSARAAGIMARSAPTIEDKKNIYKSYLSDSNHGNQETTKEMVHNWEKLAEQYRTQG